MTTSASRRPIVIAHRHGNSLRNLRKAELLGADVIEADLFFHRGCIEVRHSKTMGPVPLLWDRWSLGPGWTPRFQLTDLLAAAAPATTLMLDIKRDTPGMARAVIASMREHGPERRYWVCSQSWSVLEPFRSLENVRAVHSIGSQKALGEFFRRFQPGECTTASVHRKLLSQDIVSRLRLHAGSLVTWPVNTPAVLEQLLDWGVDGITTDRPGAVLGNLRR